ncbi:MAG TPA: chemotaxis protein CheW [Pyrinomonadaceae bacterium]|nr:chemotaxis protein CheW [Pyrinomonadaceae bacterium]
MKERRKLFVMRTGARLFAVYADEVETTCENLTPTPLPFAPAPVRGIVSRRGRILTLIDPHTLLPGATQAPAPQAQTLAAPAAMRAPYVVALKGDEQLALAVESIEHDIELYDDATDIETDDQTSLPLVRRLIPYRAHTIALLDPARLFETAMRGVERRRQRT